MPWRILMIMQDIQKWWLLTFFLENLLLPLGCYLLNALLEYVDLLFGWRIMLLVPHATQMFQHHCPLSVLCHTTISLLIIVLSWESNLRMWNQLLSRKLCLILDGWRQWKLKFVLWRIMKLRLLLHCLLIKEQLAKSVSMKSSTMWMVLLKDWRLV